MEIKSTPTFEHSCKSCKFMGNVEGHDLYFCSPHPSVATIVARFGNDADLYNSGLAGARFDKYLNYAARLAQLKGYLSFNEVSEACQGFNIWDLASLHLT